MEEEGKCSRLAIKNSRTVPFLFLPPSLTNTSPLLFLAAPPVICPVGTANRSNRKQLESTAAARPPGLTGLVQQVLRGEADTRLTAAFANTEGRDTQDGKKNCLHPLTLKAQLQPMQHTWDSKKAT